METNLVAATLQNPEVSFAQIQPVDTSTDPKEEEGTKEKEDGDHQRHGDGQTHTRLSTESSSHELLSPGSSVGLVLKK